jgi:hypothetical protein
MTDEDISAPQSGPNINENINMKLATFLFAGFAATALGQSFLFEAFETSDPETGVCPTEPVAEGSGSDVLGCQPVPQGFNAAEFDGALAFELLMYESEDCSGTADNRGPGAVGCITFLDTRHSWQVTRA